MEVGAVKATDINIPMPGQRAGTPAETKPAMDTATPVQFRPEIIKVKDLTDVKEPSDVKELKHKEEEVVPQTIEAVNQFLDLMNADLRFSLHQKTNRLMVQLVSEKDQKVLREYPSKEFLDMIARIRDFVGLFLDKKA